MQPQEIITALEAPAEDRRPLMWQLRDEESPAALAAALAAATTPFTRQLLADLLGFQAAPEGAGALTLALADPDLKVRASAADALGKLYLAHPDAPGREDAGVALLARFGAEDQLPVKHMLAAALGATRYEPALPALREAAQDQDPGLRDAAGWSLAQF
jgi:HEAT repeat protein